MSSQYFSIGNDIIQGRSPWNRINSSFEVPDSPSWRECCGSLLHNCVVQHLTRPIWEQHEELQVVEVSHTPGIGEL